MMKPTKFVWGGTSEKEWELLADITTQEEVNTIDITQALDETLFSNLNLTEMFIFFRVKPTEDVDNDYGVFIVNDKNIQVGQQFGLYTNGQFRYFSAYFKLFKNGDAVIQFKDNNNSALASNTGGFQFHNIPILAWPEEPDRFPYQEGRVSEFGSLTDSSSQYSNPLKLSELPPMQPTTKSPGQTYSRSLAASRTTPPTPPA